MWMNEYRSINSRSEAEHKVLGSKFIAVAESVHSEEDFKNFHEKIKKEHFKARHHCYAYRILIGADLHERANDDGEPSGTAGKPILGQLLSHNLHNVAIIVIRYFGGTKLGTGGLIKAYKKAAELVIEQSEIETVKLYEKYLIELDYNLSSIFLNAAKRLDVLIQSQKFSSKAEFVIGLDPHSSETDLIKLKSLTFQIPIEMAEADTNEAWQVHPLGIS